MKTAWSNLLLVSLCVVCCTTLRAQDAPAGYTLALGDVISINVFDESDLSFDRVQITDTGTIPFPFIGNIQATDRTVAEIQAAIIAGLKPDYLIEPKVTVSIVEYRPFFITGEVMKPGSVPYQPGLTLRQAITVAGGFTERASQSKFTVISGGKDGQPERIDLNYLVKPGDTITVEESFF